ncbi:MAG: hypothetical protein PF445_09840, partial [Melioribacteraceae bacterium]|nr:hypothetical protein [Melioribacteraceae bacterium]
MRDGTVSSNDTLKFMLQTKNMILDEIYDSYGEIDETQEEQLLELDINIPEKVDGWAWTLMNNGVIDSEINLLKEKKRSIDEMINRLKSGKDKRKTSVNDILRQNGLERIDGCDYWLKRDTSKSTRVIISKVEAQYKTYQLPKLSNSEYQILIDILDYLIETEANEISQDEFNLTSSILTKFKEEKVETCGVTELPKNHTALEVTTTPTIR